MPDADRILVPISKEGGWEFAIRLACALARKPASTIQVVYVIELERAAPLDAEMEPEIRKAEQLLDKARDMAANSECEFDTSILQSRETGPAIVDEAVERQAGLIVLGVRYMKQFGEFTLGEVVPHVLKYAPCPVLIVREPPPPASPA